MNKTTNIRAIFTTDPDTYDSMTYRPNTPGHERYIEAARKHYEWEHQNNMYKQQGSPNYTDNIPSEEKEFEEFTDLEHYDNILCTKLWEEEIQSEFIEDVRYEPQRALQIIMALAHEGSSDSTIGVALCDYTPTIGEDETRVSFTRISRHPDWMGMSPIFDAMHGFTGFVFQEPQSNNPAFVILTNNLPGEKKHRKANTFPNGQPTVLKELLNRMDAKAVWTTWNGDYDQHPDIPIQGKPVTVSSFNGGDLYDKFPYILFQYLMILDPYQAQTVPLKNYNEMINWPHTPTEKRYRDAYDAFVSYFHQHSDQETEELEDKALSEYTDLHHYMELCNTELWNEKAEFLIAMEYQREEETLTIQSIMNVAARGDTEATIGLAHYDPTQRTHRDPISHLKFTRLSRHPDWMGMCPVLSSLETFQALVFQKPGTQEPSFVIIAPKAEKPTHQPAQPPPFPEGQATALKEILSFHSIVSTWVPQVSPGSTLAAP